MKESKLIQYFILVHWLFFAGTTALDKLIPDVYPLWVGADFYTLFVKLFASLGIKDPIFATAALSAVSVVEIASFVCFLLALILLVKSKKKSAEHWFSRGILLSLVLFSFFSIGDQVFGDRFTLLEHGIFWCILLVSWLVFLYFGNTDNHKVSLAPTKMLRTTIIAGIVLTVIASISLFQFSSSTWDTKNTPVAGVKISDNMYKFDFPFLGDKYTLENTLKTFKEDHPELKVNYIYTGPSELNTKKKTHMLLYVFTEKVKQ
ncbi:MAG: hypothetical protein QMC70_10005 [Bacteroidia bacterium]|jgi:hypothetical protein|tara:strand:+ start:560 stop:1342 length:783 start_codon:yes stop_codon:yes gene_type:complete